MTAPVKKSFLFSILLIGFSTIIVQTLFIREFLTLFYGNEIVIGSFFGIWLFWTAAGSGWLARYILPKKHLQPVFTLVQLAWILLALVTLLLIRALPALFSLNTGEITGYLTILRIIFITIAPFCIFSGILYTLACYLYTHETQSVSAYTRVYLWEAIGATSGGLMLSFIFLSFLNPVQIIFVITGLNIVVILTNLKKKYWPLTGLFIFLTFLLFIIGPELETISQTWLWPESESKSVQTRYGTLTFTQTGGQYNFFSNGLHIFTVPDKMTAETNTHLAILQHKSPESILLVGGGFSGTFTEIFKYRSIRKIDFVELDPGLFAFVNKHLPNELQPPDTSILHYHFMDGRRFIQRSKEKYDIVCINLPNPYTIQLNRFYTLEFFRLVYNHLHSEGVMSIRLSASENIIGPELANYLGSIYSTLKEVFPHVVILPGENAGFIASPNSTYLTNQDDTLIKRLLERNIETHYIRDYYLQYQFSEDRTAYFNEQITNAPGIRINRDKLPVGYYFDIILWATYFSTYFKTIFSVLSQINIFWFMIGIALVSALICGITSVRTPESKKSHWLYSIYVIGFTEISIEYIYILLFQIYFGYVFHQIAIIIAFYMTGLAIGSYTALKQHSTSKKQLNLKMILVQTAMLLCTIVFFFSMNIMSPESAEVLTQNTGIIILTALLILNGFLGGFQFITANYLLEKNSKNQAYDAGTLYGIDLLGSSFGIVLMTIFLIPVLGIESALLLLVYLNTLALLFLIFTRRIKHK